MQLLGPQEPANALLQIQAQKNLRPLRKEILIMSSQAFQYLITP